MLSLNNSDDSHKEPRTPKGNIERQWNNNDAN